MIVLLGGLTMPKTGINPEKAKEIARKVLENSEKKNYRIMFSVYVHAAEMG